MRRDKQSGLWRPYHGAMTYVTSSLRAGIAVVIVSVLGWLGGCSDNPSGADGYQGYFVDLFESSADQVNDSVHVHVVVEVGDSIGGSRVAGAIVRFRVSRGTVVPQTVATGAEGLATGEWTFEGVMGGPGPSVLLQACASNSTSRCDEYSMTLIISIRGP
jgi:hypothetical protein